MNQPVNHNTEAAASFHGEVQRYTGTKTVFARPMSRGDYNTYRGWTVPANEDPADTGYLVEYADGGKANDSRHAGYISWSPTDVFERAYKLDVPTTFQDRVRAEADELDGRIEKLKAFTTTATFANLPAAEQARMHSQMAAMLDYSSCLAERIAAFTA